MTEKQVSSVAYNYWPYYKFPPLKQILKHRISLNAFTQAETDTEDLWEERLRCVLVLYQTRDGL